MDFVFDDLEKKSIPELEEIKKQKMDELFNIQQQRLVLISNILSLQNMIGVVRENNRLVN